MTPPQTNFELTIEKLVYGGAGLGRVAGHVVFTPYVLAGEHVLVKTTSAKGGLLQPSGRSCAKRCAGSAKWKRRMKSR